MRLCIRSQHRVFLVSCCPMVLGYTWKDSERFVPRGLLLLERNLEKGDFTIDEFLHKEINNKDLYVADGATGDISGDTCILRQYGDLLLIVLQKIFQEIHVF